MRVLVTFLLFFTLWIPFVSAQVPNVIGWHSIPNTRLDVPCLANPDWNDIKGIESCSGITQAWGGGVFDTINNRLLIWGGGHNAYHGNELYALNVGNGTTAPTMQRISESSNPFTLCSATNPDGRPTSRHSYDQIVFIPHLNTFYNKGGAFSCNFGGVNQDAHSLDLTSVTGACIPDCIPAWTQKVTGPSATGNFYTTAYDPTLKLVWVMDDQGIFRTYNPDTDTWTVKGTTGLSTSGRNDHKTGVVDPIRRLYLYIGDGNIHAWDLKKSTPTIERWFTTGPQNCEADFGPGVAYDKNTGTIVCWVGGDNIYRLDTATRTWTQETYSGGPITGPNGIWKRFSYVPDQNMFVVCDQVNTNCFALRTSLTISPIKNFVDRCAAFGVKKCVGFDEQIDISPNNCFATNNCWSVEPQGMIAGQATVSLDNSLQASGQSALRFDIEVGDIGNANFFANICDDFSCLYGANQSIYLSFRQYMGTGFTKFSNAGFKQMNFGTGSTGTGVANSYSSCTDLEVVMQWIQNRGFMQAYNKCPPINTWEEPFSGTFKLQNARTTPFCLHSQTPAGGGASDGSDLFPPNGNCWRSPENQWIAYKVELHIGSVGTPPNDNHWINSIAKIWYALPGGNWDLLHDWRWGTSTPTQHFRGSPGENQRYGQVWLLPRNDCCSPPWPTNVFTLYDELIISEQDIAAPGAVIATSPTAPSNLVVRQR